MANTAKKDSTKPVSTSSTDADIRQRDLDATKAQRDAREAQPKEDSEPTQSDKVRDEIDAHAQAVKDNPDHPEEAVETQYLVGGEIPANAPGTEGMERA